MGKPASCLGRLVRAASAIRRGPDAFVSFCPRWSAARWWAPRELNPPGSQSGCRRALEHSPIWGALFKILSDLENVNIELLFYRQFGYRAEKAVESIV